MKTTDSVTFEGRKLEYREYEYYMLNKLACHVSATEDRIHKTVLELITETKRKDLFPVGRLDIDTKDFSSLQMMEIWLTGCWLRESM